MEKSIYEDYKYSIQDTVRLYVGSRYTFGELLEEEELSFKFRLIMERYVLPHADPGDTLETHLYYLPPTGFLVKLYRQMKAKVKVNVIEEKKGPLGRGKREYVTRQLPIEQLTAMTKEEKEACGMVIQELSVSKLALMAL